MQHDPHYDHGHRRPQHEGNVEGQDVEIAELMPEQENSRDTSGRIVEYDASAVRFEHANVIADNVPGGEQRHSRTGHDQVNAIEFKRPPETASDHPKDIAPRQVWIINQGD
jgi:hypothetical protein